MTVLLDLCPKIVQVHFPCTLFMLEKEGEKDGIFVNT